MPKLGLLDATFSGTVTWTGPATIRTGKAGSVTLWNKTPWPIEIQKQVEQRWVNMGGSHPTIEKETLSNPQYIWIPSGGNHTSKGSVQDWDIPWNPSKGQQEKRKIITYIGTEAEQAISDEMGNGYDTDPPDPVADDLGPFDDFTDPNDASGNGSTSSGGLGGNRTMTVILLLVAVLLGAGGGYALRGAMIKRALGLP